MKSESLDSFIEENITIAEERKRIIIKWLCKYYFFWLIIAIFIAYFSWNINIFVIIFGPVLWMIGLFPIGLILFLLTTNLPKYLEFPQESIKDLFKECIHDVNYSENSKYFEWDIDIISDGKHNKFLYYYTRFGISHSIELIHNGIKVVWCELRTTKKETERKNWKRRKYTVVTNNFYLLKFFISSPLLSEKKVYLTKKTDKKIQKELKRSHTIYTFTSSIIGAFVILVAILTIMWILWDAWYHTFINKNEIEFWIIFITLAWIVTAVLFRISKSYEHKKSKEWKVFLPQNINTENFNIYSNNSKGIAETLEWEQLQHILKNKDLRNNQFLITKDALYIKIELKKYFNNPTWGQRKKYIQHITDLRSDIQKIADTIDLITDKKNLNSQ